MFFEILKYLVIAMFLHGMNIHLGRKKDSRNLYQEIQSDSLMIQKYDSLIVTFDNYEK